MGEGLWKVVSIESKDSGGEGGGVGGRGWKGVERREGVEMERWAMRKRGRGAW